MSAPRARAPRPPRTPIDVPPLFEALDETHRQVVQRLRDLEQLMQRLDGGDADDDARRLAAGIVAFFSEVAQPHHDAEERYVFPALIASGDDELVQHVQRLQQDHGWLEEDWIELSPALRDISEGHGAFDLDNVRHMATVFGTLYLEHLALEESLIYPEAKRRLDAGRKAEVRRLGEGGAS
jgi:hemerythrin-like domain-containing protein